MTEYDGTIREPFSVGALAAALAKAQAVYPAIQRTREVTVQTRTGGKYTFRYAPLDTILEAVRGPLSANGLAITQLLDGSDLVTVLLHESGGTLTARTPLPTAEGDTVQQYGSAVTYIRRYALQAILGIASEEDDDGNASAGNTATARKPAEPEHDPSGGLIGIAEAGKGQSDFELRQTPHGYALAFRLVSGRKGIKAVAVGAMAEWLAEHRAGIEGQRVTCHGVISDEKFTNSAGKEITYQVLNLSKIETPTGRFPQRPETAQDAPRSVEPEETAPVAETLELAACGAEDDSPMAMGACESQPGHKGAHRSAFGTWP